MISLRNFFRFLNLTVEVIDSDPTKKLVTPKLNRSLPKFMHEEECIALLNSIDGTNKERDYCIFVLFINSGIRLSELVGLNYTDIDRQGDVVIRGKGSKERRIIFNKACLEALAEYEKFKEIHYQNKERDRDAVFVGRTGKRLTARRIEQIVKQRITAAGFGGRALSLHKLRHTAATLMISNGVDIKTVQEVLGHEHLNTTEIYTHIENSELKIAAEANPLSHIHLKETQNEKDKPDF